MRQTIRLGRVGGIPVGMHWSVLVILLLLTQSLALVLLPGAAAGLGAWTYWIVALAASVLFIASLLAHELAHALVARHYRMRVERVTLWLLGGVAELGGESSTPRVDLLVAVVGPFTSLVMGGIFFAATIATTGWLPAVVVAGLAWLAWVNVLLAGFNLLPAAPLDGGRVLRALLWRRWGDRTRAEVTAARAGRGLGGAMVALGLVQIMITGTLAGIWWGLLGWFLITAARAEEQVAGLSAALGDVPARAAMDPHPAMGLDRQSVQEFLDAVVAPSRRRSYLVMNLGGEPVGTVRLAELARVPRAQRMTTPVGGVMTPIRTTVEADAPIAEIAASTAPAVLLPVFDHGEFVGVLDPGDVARAIDLARLGLPVGPRGATVDE